jgi:Mg-chelatase subunit ChlD
MINLPFKRPVVCMAIAAQLMGCTAGAMGAAPVSGMWPQDADWAPDAPHRVLAKPNFSAPSAQHCARSVRTREVSAGQNAEQRASGTSGATHEMMADSVGSSRASEETFVKGTSEGEKARKSAAPPAPVAMASPSMMAKSASPAANPAAAGAVAQPQPQALSQQVTAGVVDDNANFGEYLAYRSRTQVPHNARDISDRYLLQVRDAKGHSVADAEVRIESPNGAAMWARTDSAGQVWVSPKAFDANGSSTYQVSVRKQGPGGLNQATSFLRRGQKSVIEVTLGSAVAQRAQLDLVFLVDATGSMGDEIDKLKASLNTIASEVARLPAKPDLCFGLVAYRDKGDQYLIRSHDLTNDLNAFQGVLNQLQAGGGGDYPEAMNEALHDTVHNISWRGSGTTRMVFLLADAPPHLDYGGPQYDEDMVAALGKGIKVFGVGASGLDKQGEYIQRQIAQYTGGKFVFLTYDQANDPASGPGRETVHDVKNYGVDTLDRLIVRLVREDLAKLGKLGQPG